MLNYYTPLEWIEDGITTVCFLGLAWLAHLTIYATGVW